MNAGEVWYIVNPIIPIILTLGLIFLIGFFKTSDLLRKLMLIYLLVALLIDLLSRYFGYISALKFNLFLLPLFGWLEFILFTLMYREILKRTYDRLHFWVFMIVQVFYIVDVFITGDVRHPRTFSTYSKVLSNLMIIGYALLYFFEVSKSVRVTWNYKMLFNSSVVVYFVFNIMITLTTNFLVNEQLELIIYFWFANLILTATFYLIIIHGIWQNGKTLAR